MLETALSIGYIGFFLWIIGKSSFFQHATISNKNIQWLFLLKLAAGFVLFLVYTRFYPDRKYADIFRYYDDSKIVYDSFHQHPFDFFRMISGYHQNDKDLMLYYNQMRNWFNSEMVFNDARTMIRLNVIFRFFSAGTYYPHSIFFCFMAFGGLNALYKVAVEEIKERNFVLIVSIFCMPSVLFWTSGVIKESFLVFAIGLMIYYTNQICEKRGTLFVNIIGVLFFMFCLLNIKTYVFFSLVPGIISFVWVKQNINNAFLKFASVHAFYIAIIFMFSSVFTHHPVPELLQIKQLEFYKLAYTEQAKSVIQIPELQPELFSIIRNAPSAFLVTLLRPHVLEAHNSLMILSALENLLIFLLLITNLYFLFKRRQQLPIFTPLFLLSLFYVLITFCLIGLVTPILGAVVRYKVAAMPFLMMMLFYLNDWKDAFAFFKRLRRK